MSDIRVRPARPGMRMRHIPSGTELPDAGGSWPADSFTFRRIADGDLIEVAPEPDEPDSNGEVDQRAATPEAAPPATSQRSASR